MHSNTMICCTVHTSKLCSLLSPPKNISEKPGVCSCFFSIILWWRVVSLIYDSVFMCSNISTLLSDARVNSNISLASLLSNIYICKFTSAKKIEHLHLLDVSVTSQTQQLFLTIEWIFLTLRHKKEIHTFEENYQESRFFS